MSQQRSIILLTISALLFLFFAWMVTTEQKQLLAIDQWAVDWFKNTNKGEVLETARFFSYLGSYRVCAGFGILTALALLCHKKYRMGLWIFIGAVAVRWISNGVKRWLDRDRPPVDAFMSVSVPSFPSGHVFYAVFLYGILFFVIWLYIKKKWIHVMAAILAGILIALVGWSRVYVGVHYPTDILGGLLLGMVWLNLIWLLATFHYKWHGE